MIDNCSEPLLAITNGEPCDEFADSVWAGNKEDQQFASNIIIQNTSLDEYNNANGERGDYVL